MDPKLHAAIVKNSETLQFEREIVLTNTTQHVVLIASDNIQVNILV